MVVWLNISLLELDSLNEDETLAIFARNNKGASDPVILRDKVYRDAAKQTENTSRSDSKFPAAAAFAGLAACLTAIAAIVVLVLKKRSDNASTSKRPSQSVVQVDANGRRYLIAYPAPADKMETKPDILNPKSDSEPPRVVLESSDSKNYTIRDIHKDGHTSAPALQASYAPPPPQDDIIIIANCTVVPVASVLRIAIYRRYSLPNFSLMQVDPRDCVRRVFTCAHTPVNSESREPEGV
ncbi:hypothetical protein RR46_01414 [Papilio xuthus]|uniref:Uncharacterized protein n=1 Tax=Papilio xuthus TaxID=66420 RepID=A0A0N0P9K2_PAPXU|nr:hypothetical protein RR46_01414 [Papilio xuthus]